MGHDKDHAGEHVDGTDDIQTATAGQKGVMSTAAMSKLDDITADAIADIVEDTTPQLGGDLDLNQKSIVYDPTPTVNLTWNGHEVTLTAGASVVWGDICMLQADGKFDSADASAEATANGMIVFATETLSDAGTGVFVMPGTFIRDDSWAWTVGGPLYLSETTGEITQTKPATTGSIVRIIGYAYSADVIYFNPDASYVEVP